MRANQPCCRAITSEPLADDLLRRLNDEWVMRQFGRTRRALFEELDAPLLKPFDMETIGRAIRKTHKVIVVEECMKTGGIGAELIALITEQCFDDLDARPVRLSRQDIPTPYNGNLENLTIIQPHQIVEAAQQIVREGL